MKTYLLAAVAVLLIAMPAKAENTNTNTPGHKMQTKGPVKGEPGASGYAPGHVMQQKGSRNGPGASGYAPGHSGTTGLGDRH